MKRLVLSVSLLATSLLVADGQPVRPQGGYSELQAKRNVTPLAGPVVKNCVEFNISADFLYWQIREDYLHFAMDGDRGSINPESEGQIYDLHFQYSPGFKVGLGLDFKHDGWDLNLEYTWMQENNIQGHVESDVNNGYLDDISLRAIGGGIGANSVQAHWDIHFNAVDWVLGRHFYISRYLAFHPFMGIKGAWINQKFNCVGRYTVVTPNDSWNNTLQKQQFWGVGPRMGSDIEWHFTRNWSFYGNIGLDLLYGQFQDSVRELQRDTGNVTSDRVRQSQRCNLHSVSPIIEMSLGVRYETFFSNDRYLLFFQAGWDEQVWFNQNRFIVGLASSAGQIAGNLVLQGFDLKAGFSF